MNRAFLIAAVVATPGCFFELAGGYYPSAHVTLVDPTSQPMASSGGAWSASVKVGFYIDVPLDPGGIAVAWSPSGYGTDLMLKKDPASASGTGHMFRTDITLPLRLTEDFLPLNLRIVGEYASFNAGSARKLGETSYTADRDATDGSRWFLGPAIAITTVGGSFIAAAGVQHMSVSVPAGSDREGNPLLGVYADPAWGFGGSITLSLTPGKHRDPLPFSDGGSAFGKASAGDKCPGGGYVDHCDADGHCSQVWTCP